MVREYQEKGRGVNSEEMGMNHAGLFWREVKDEAGKIGCSRRSECQTKNFGIYLTDSV